MGLLNYSEIYLGLCLIIGFSAIIIHYLNNSNNFVKYIEKDNFLRKKKIVYQSLLNYELVSLLLLISLLVIELIFFTNKTWIMQAVNVIVFACGLSFGEQQEGMVEDDEEDDDDIDHFEEAYDQVTYSSLRLIFEPFNDLHPYHKSIYGPKRFFEEELLLKFENEIKLNKNYKFYNLRLGRFIYHSIRFKKASESYTRYFIEFFKNIESAKQFLHRNINSKYLRRYANDYRKSYKVLNTLPMHSVEYSFRIEGASNEEIEDDNHWETTQWNKDVTDLDFHNDYRGNNSLISNYWDNVEDAYMLTNILDDMLYFQWRNARKNALQTQDYFWYNRYKELYIKNWDLYGLYEDYCVDFYGVSFMGLSYAHLYNSKSLHCFCYAFLVQRNITVQPILLEILKIKLKGLIQNQLNTEPIFMGAIL